LRETTNTKVVTESKLKLIILGEWKEDKMHGIGTFLYASGASYHGEWVDNKYEGKGVFKFPDNSSYEGEWRDNK
jgi:hypothetical protein